MNLLIRGADMPKSKIGEKAFYPCTICVHPDGIAKITINNQVGCVYPITEIPASHGRLIDADVAIARLKYLYCENCGNSCERCPWGAFIKYIEARPTIVDKS